MNPRSNVAAKDRTAYRHYIQSPREKKARQDSAAQTIAETKGKHLAAALAQAEEEYFEASDDGEHNAQVEAMTVLNPVIWRHHSSRNPVFRPKDPQQQEYTFQSACTSQLSRRWCSTQVYT